jgi:hypothetical protein
MIGYSKQETWKTTWKEASRGLISPHEKYYMWQLGQGISAM